MKKKNIVMSWAAILASVVVVGAASPSIIKQPQSQTVKEGSSATFSVVATDKSGDITIPLSWTVNLEMIWVNPGTFVMGSPEDELGRFSRETQHQVTLTKGYWLGKYEVTQGQYEAVMGKNPFLFKRKRENLPVKKVTWHKAMRFCARLTEIERAAGRLPEGYEYTLPTEAQWEYACRAGTTTVLNSGKNLTDEYECFNLDEVGWYGYNSDQQTHPVGGKQPNNWGFYDMHGNVWEWCLDRYGDYPTGSVTDPTGPATGSNRVIRGGCWHDDAYFCRSAYRNIADPSHGNHFGFRVALSPVKKVNPEMIWVEPGTFMMGSPEDELGRYSDERQHQVTLTKGYWLGKYEVTQGQYKAVMGSNPSCFEGENLPVEQVSWYNAMRFCAKLTRIEKKAGRLPEGYEYTLPTEAQWEYACRAGTTEALNSGKNLTDKKECSNLDEVGWYRGNSDWQAHPVGEKQANAWGFYDMHGNVWEWCLDWFGDYPTGSVTDPTGRATDDSYRVLRGGSWDNGAYDCRSAIRDYYYPSNYYSNYGFRVALSQVQ